MDNDKYDRQLKLWGEKGQKCLEQSHVCIIGTNFLTQEVVKNLSLAGIGHLTLIFDDGDDIQPVESSLFFDNSNIEILNTDIKWNKFTWSEVTIKSSYWWTYFDLVIFGSRKKDVIRYVNKIWCSSTDLPIMIWSFFIGFYGYTMVISNELHCVFESHPQYFLHDLRLDKPWDSLIQYTNSVNWKKPIHIPYPALLIEVRNRLILNNRSINRQFIQDELHKFHSELLTSDFSDNPNFVEAEKYAYSLINDSSDIPENLVNALKLLPCNLSSIKNPMNRQFWILMKALVEFIKNNSSLPLSGVIPDMESSTYNYNYIKRIYLEKGRQDMYKFKKLLTGDISDSLVNTFIQNLRNSRVIHFSKVYSSNELFQKVLMLSNDDLNSLLKCLVALQFGYKVERNPDLAFYMKQIEKFNGINLTSISGILGGIISQEAIKILTHQYAPLENTFIYDGLNNKTFILKL